jgi:D-3-phosphoglycerate dehydrogenase/C-terminal binding protein
VQAAIESEHLRGAAIDVLEVEPPADDDPLIQAWRTPGTLVHDRVIINPHAAFYSEEGMDDIRIKGSQNCLRVLQGKSPRNVVN